MIKLKIKNYNMILIKNQQKYRHYYLEKLINMNISQVKKYYHLIKVKIIEKAKFTHFPLGKEFEKQTKTIEDQGEKQIKALQEQGKQLVKYSDEKESFKTKKTHLKQKKF